MHNLYPHILLELYFLDINAFLWFLHKFSKFYILIGVAFQDEWYLTHYLKHQNCKQNEVTEANLRQRTQKGGRDRESRGREGEEGGGREGWKEREGGKEGERDCEGGRER